MKILFVLIFCSSIFSIQSKERNEFKHLGTHYERNLYEDTDFDDFDIDELLTHNLTINEYKFITKKGLGQYFKLMNAIKDNKQVTSGNYIIDDELNLTKSSNGEKIILDSVRGFSAVKIENPRVTTTAADKFEVRSIFHLPQLIFSGHLVDKNQSFQQKWLDVSYTSTELKKIDQDYEIKLIQSTEQMHFNKIELEMAAEKGSTNKMLERDIQQLIADYLFETINFMRGRTADYWFGADSWYLRQRRDQLVDKLTKIALRYVQTFSRFNCELPRFAFGDQKSSVDYEMVNGNLEVEAASVQTVSKNVNEAGQLQMTFPISGWLKYYVAQQNCTSACHFYGHRFQVTKADARVTFLKNKIRNVEWFFEMKFVDSLVDNRLKPQNEDLFHVVLENVSKIVNEKFLGFLKSFLGPDFISL